MVNVIKCQWRWAVHAHDLGFLQSWSQRGSPLERSRLPALAGTEIARFPGLATASGAGVLESDLLPVPKAEHSPHRDRGAFPAGALPRDRQELRLWFHRLQ